MSEQFYHSEKNYCDTEEKALGQKTEKHGFFRDAGQSQMHHLRREMSRRWMARFTLELFVYIGCVAVIAVLGYRYCASRIWYGTDLFYGFIHILHENWTAVFGTVLLVGCIVIAYLNFYKIAHLTEQLTEAVGSVYRNQESAIRLPRELKEEENQLNQIRIEAEASRQEAHEAQQRKNDMLMYMAHDLKTPLTSVIGYLSLLNEETEIPEATRQRYLGIVLKKAEHLEDLINGFFEITRFNFSHMILEKSYVDMAVMVNQMLYEFQPMFEEKGLWFTLEAEESVQVYCDVEKMERVFDNLFKNVANYSYPNTEIRVELTNGGRREKMTGAEDLLMVIRNKGENERGREKSSNAENQFSQNGVCEKNCKEQAKDSTVSEKIMPEEKEKTKSGMRLVVENHGRTIPPEKLSHLFEQFFRLDSSRASATGGSGLGLAVVKEIVQLHGGTVACESENERIRFVVELP